MTINFIGHGLSKNKSHESVGKHLLTSFKDESFNKFIGFSAYASKGGVKKLVPALEVAKSRFEEIKFFIGIDDKVTKKEVFDLLMSSNIDCYVFHNRESEAIFHPKIYIFEGKRKNRIILGSSNMTAKGLFNFNIEASVVIDFVIGDVGGTKFLKQIKDFFKDIINLQSKNVDTISPESLERFVSEGLINSNVNTKKEKIISESEGDLVVEVEKFHIINGDLDDIKSNNKTIVYAPSADKDKNELSQHYFNTWSSYFDALVHFKNKFGHTNVDTFFEDQNLLEWCRKQKYLKKNALLPKEHEIQLNNINFYWDSLQMWNSEQSWNKSFAEFKQYYLKHRTFSVTRKKNKELANWVITARHEYHKGLLPDYQVKNMDDLDPNWKLTDKEINEAAWLNNLLALQEYKKKNGNCNVPQTDEMLGRWVNDQRTDKKREKLSSEKVDLLNSLGFVWNVRSNEFDVKLERLIDYKKKFGNFDVPLKYVDKSLASWVYGLKQRGTTPENTEKLNALGFDWEKHYDKVMVINAITITKDWRTRLNNVKKASSQGVDVNNISTDQLHLKAIKTWLVSQQKRYRDNELKDEQIELLIDAGVKLEKISSHDQRWSALYELLVLYKNEHGHCRVKSAFDEELFNWVSTQRGSFKDKILDPYKIEKLNELDFEWIVGKKKK
jgi:HKD family nuclease